MKQQLSTLLQKQMGRKEFLQHAGVSVMMLVGGGLVVQSLTGTTRKSTVQPGYGASAYGGVKKA